MMLRIAVPGYVASAALAVLLSACASAPKYERPAVQTPSAYKDAGDWKVAQPRDDIQRGKWWEIFGDARLNSLMEQIDISNQNVRIAEAQYRQARALAQQARSGLLPRVSGDVSVGRAASRSGVNNDYNLSLDAAWEADVWGRVSSSVAAGAAGAQAGAAQVEAVRLSAQGEMALNYFQLRVLDVQRRLLEESAAAFQKSLDLTRNRYAAGVAGRVDVVQGETQLKSTQALALDVGVQRAQLEHAMAVLSGKVPGEFALAPEATKLGMPAIPSSVPSELLERRPDIAAAERRVAAANAQIGVAKAAYFPSLGLSASGGFQSSSFTNWLTVPSRVWALGAALAQTIFDGGLRRAVTDQAVAAYDANVAAYRLTVLGGFQEVEDNLAALRILEQESRVQDEAVQAARQSVELTLNQYKAGTVSYLNVVVAQTALLTNERTAAGLLGRRLAAAVSLVKALGGGWTSTQISQAGSIR